jgi:hypothetical protein
MTGVKNKLFIIIQIPYKSMSGIFLPLKKQFFFNKSLNLSIKNLTDFENCGL